MIDVKQHGSLTESETEALQPFIRCKRIGDGSHVTDAEIGRMVAAESHRPDYPLWWETLPPAIFQRLKARFRLVKGSRIATAYT
ncbi:hypothetical protein [Bifidobacterium panos]|uniref:Uncharacterized protein n=1 Tax=Bifidobacterium panos TaxID=2675321 RepID=A0ABX1SY94_9BIFI|nr:hypothetical protein [Bifidobacterium sp. DSM 109963]NMN02809.1 hypothetical protein [Bifidobacterium sp. DSM 109963]